MIDPHFVQLLRARAEEVEPVNALLLGLPLGLSRSQVQATVELLEMWGYLRRHAGQLLPISLTERGRSDEYWSIPGEMER